MKTILPAGGAAFFRGGGGAAALGGAAGGATCARVGSGSTLIPLTSYTWHLESQDAATGCHTEQGTDTCGLTR